MYAPLFQKAVGGGMQLLKGQKRRLGPRDQTITCLCNGLWKLSGSKYQRVTCDRLYPGGENQLSPSCNVYFIIEASGLEATGAEAARRRLNPSFFPNLLITESF